jgi:pentatricopeptide repeat protein
VQSSLVNIYSKNSDVEFALKVFDEMPSRDKFSWTVSVDGLCKCGKVEVAREIFY